MSTAVATKQPEAIKTLADIRAIAKQTGFAAKIFRQGAIGLTPAQLTQQFRQILNLAGIDLPKGAIITLDVVQVVLAGGVLTNSIALGKSIQQCANPIGLTISAVTGLLADIGIMSPAISNVVSLGVNVMLIISSGGANILAWIGAAMSLFAVALDIGHGLFGNAEEAIAESKKMLVREVNGRFNSQKSYALAQVALYNDGKINPFDMIGNIAHNSPMLIKDFMPELKSYFPSWVQTTITVTATSQGLFSDESHSESFTFPQSLVTDDGQISRVLIKKYILEPMKGYEKDFIPSDQISLSALTTLVMLTATTSGEIPLIGFDYDVVSVCRVLGITPYILGDDWVFEGRWSRATDAPFNKDSSLPYSPITLPEAKFQSSGAKIVVNGKRIDRDLDYAAKLKSFQYSLYLADRQSDMDTLAKNPEGMAILKRWGKLNINPTWPVKRQNVIMGNIRSPNPQQLTVDQQGIYTDIGVYAKVSYGEKKPFTGEFEPTNLKLKNGCSPISDQPWFELNYAVVYGNNDPTYREYIRNNYLIDLSDYMKCLSTVSMMQKAEIFKKTGDADFVNAVGSLEKINNNFDVAYKFVLYKSMNQVSRNNIAEYIGVDPQNLQSRTIDNQTVYK